MNTNPETAFFLPGGGLIRPTLAGPTHMSAHAEVTGKEVRYGKKEVLLVALIPRQMKKKMYVHAWRIRK